MWPIDGKTLYLGISPAGVGIREKGKPHCTRHDSPCEMPGSGTSLWHRPLKTLRDALACTPVKGIHLRVALSHHFLRFYEVPWSDTLMTRAGSRALVCRYFEDTFGDAPDAWEFALEEGGRGKPRCVCALPREVSEEIQDAIANARGRLDWLGPWLVPALERGRKVIAGSHGWFAAVEPGVLALGRIDSGSVRQVTLHHWESDWSAELARQVYRAALRQGLAEGLPVSVASLIPPSLGSRTDYRMCLGEPSSPADAISDIASVFR